MNNSGWRSTIILLAIAACGYRCAAAPDKQYILETLRQFDAVYTENGFTVAGTMTELSSEEHRPGQPDVTRNWRMTIKGGRAATIYQVVGPIEGIHFVEPGSSPRADYDLSGHMLVGVMTKREVYCDSVCSGMYTEHTVHVVDRDNCILDKGISRNVIKSGAGLTGAGRYIKEILWSVGRGFSQFIDEITEVEELADGKVRVVAEGRQSDVYPGRWELVIDTEAAWMVRHAKFYHETHPDKIDFESTNSGLTWNGPLAMPAKAASNYGGPLNQKIETLKVAFVEISSKLDEKLLEQTSSSIRPPFVDKTTIMIDRPKDPIFLNTQDIKTTATKALSSLDTESVANAHPVASMDHEKNEPNSESMIYQKTTNKSEPPRRPWYLLPKGVAYVILASALAGVAVYVLAAKRF